METAGGHHQKVTADAAFLAELEYYDERLQSVAEDLDLNSSFGSTQVAVQALFNGDGGSQSDLSGDYDMFFFRSVPYLKAMKTVPVGEMVIKVFFFSAVMALAIVGNVLVITTVIRCKRMHKTTYYYLINLAVSDLAITLSCSWVYLVDDLTEGWVLGAFFCKFNSFVQVLSLVSSILTLTLIACDRFFGIVFALKARLTERRSSTFILAVWIISVGISAPLLFYRSQFTRPWLNHTEVWCGDTWPYDARFDVATNRTLVWSKARTIYYTSVSLVLYFVPMVVVSLAYTAIVYKLWSRRPPGEEIRHVPTNGRSATSVGDARAIQLRTNKKVILMLVVVLMVFGICWLPFQISILYPEFRSDPHSTLPGWYHGFQYFATFLAYANSAFNPVIYTCFNDTFRTGFLDAFKVRRSRGFSMVAAGVGGGLLDERSRCYNYYNTNTIELRLDNLNDTLGNSCIDDV